MRDIRELNRKVLDQCRDAVAATQSVARRTRSAIRSCKREVLENIVKEKDLLRPTA